jgi:hypothetical protein
MTETTSSVALGQSLDWFGRVAMDSISVRDRVDVSSPLCAATTGRSLKDAIDPERPSTVSKLIKLMRRTDQRTIH